MLNKQVKSRIASNKRLHAVPRWKRQARSYFINQLSGLSQPLLSSKHMEDGEAVAKTHLDRIHEIETHAATLTRAEWYEMVKAGLVWFRPSIAQQLLNLVNANPNVVWHQAFKTSKAVNLQEFGRIEKQGE